MICPRSLTGELKWAGQHSHLYWKPEEGLCLPLWCSDVVNYGCGLGYVALKLHWVRRLPFPAKSLSAGIRTWVKERKDESLAPGP